MSRRCNCQSNYLVDTRKLSEVTEFITIITATYNRPKELEAIAYPSLLSQTCTDFEWVVVNDGASSDTRELISSISPKFPVRYLETPRLGLGGARNLGLTAASGELVSYLDDDNAIAPNFIEETIAFFNRNPTATYSMVRQRRQRNVVDKGQLIKSGNVFISPSADSEIGDLLLMKQLFDSNGFVHHRVRSPSWNPALKVFADYEYLLKCASLWGEDRFQLNQSILVNYIQTNEGIIGQSNYGQWSQELESIWMGRKSYSVFETFSPKFLLELIDKYKKKSSARLTAFM